MYYGGISLRLGQAVIILCVMQLVFWMTGAGVVVCAEQKASMNKAVELYLKAAKFRSDGKFEDALPIADKSLQEMRKLNGQKTTLYASILTLYGELLLYTGESIKASEVLSSAVLIFQDAAETEQYDFARAAGLLAQSLGKLKLYSQAGDFFRTAEGIYQRETGACSSDYAGLLYVRGCMNFTRGDFPKAMPDLRKAAEIWRANNVISDARVIDCLGKLAEAYQKSSNNDNAQKCLLLAVEIVYKAFGAESQQYICALTNLRDYYKSIDNRDLYARYSSEVQKAQHYRQIAQRQLEKEKAYSKCPPKR